MFAVQPCSYYTGDRRQRAFLAQVELLSLFLAVYKFRYDFLSVLSHTCKLNNLAVLKQLAMDTKAELSFISCFTFNKTFSISLVLPLIFIAIPEQFLVCVVVVLSAYKCVRLLLS